MSVFTLRAHSAPRRPDRSPRSAQWRAIGLILLIATSLVLLLSAGGALPALAGPGERASRTGWLTVTWGDGPPGSRVDSTLLALVSDDGESTPILLDEAVARRHGGISDLNRRRLTLVGQWANPQSPQTSALRVETVQLDSAASALSGPSAAAVVSGSQPWVNILCRFSDVAAEPKPLSYFNGLLGETKPGLGHYWREASYDSVNILGSGSVGWYSLPQPRSYYVGLSASTMLTQLFNDCTAAANADVFFPDYVGVNLMFNAELDGSAWGGSRFANLDGQSRFWYTTWEPPWGYGNQAVIAHEMGHGFGLPHSSGTYGQTYDNEWDVMSGSWANCARSTDPTYGCLGQHTISYHKDKLGWIPDAQQFTMAQGSQTITLERLALPQSNNYKFALIPIGGSSTLFYTIEVRRWAGYDIKLPGEAIIIHEVDTTRLNPAHVIDIDGNGDTGDAGAMWLAGESFIDAANGITVSVNSASGSTFVVTIALGVAVTPSSTPVATHTPTSTTTRTPTASPTRTSTPMATASPTKTSTSTPTRTPTATASKTPTGTPSRTPTVTPSHTSTSTLTRTPTASPSPSATYTKTPLPTATRTPTHTPLPTNTNPPVASNTPLPTATPTRTPVPTATSTMTPAPTATQTKTPLPSATSTSTYTATPAPTTTPTKTATHTALPTATVTLTYTSTGVPSPTPSKTATNTAAPTATHTRTVTATQVPSATPTRTKTPTNTAAPTLTYTPTATPTQVPTATPTKTPTRTPTNTLAPTATYTITMTATNGPGPTATYTKTSTLTPLPSATSTLTRTPTSAPTSTAPPSSTPSATATQVAPTATRIPSPTASLTPTPEPEPEDLNLDGQVNVLDLQLCVNVFLGVETDPVVVARADVNGDGAVNVQDVQRITKAFLTGSG